MPDQTHENGQPVSVGSTGGSAWRYHRLKGVSKWVRGNSWVTKFDDHTWCACGYNGKPLLAWMVADPKVARQHINEMLSPNDGHEPRLRQKKDSQ